MSMSNQEVKNAFQDAVKKGLLRIRVLPDENVDLEYLLGDMYNPEVNPEIPEEELKRQERLEVDRIAREGVWGIVGEIKCTSCGQWEYVSSCWGFVGEDWKDCGDIDIMHECLQELVKSKVS
jgi:hypothetical protein